MVSYQQARLQSVTVMGVENYELRRTWAWQHLQRQFERKINAADSRDGILHHSQQDLASRDVSQPSQLSRALGGHIMVVIQVEINRCNIC